MDRSQVLEVKHASGWTYICYFGVFAFVWVLCMYTLGVLILCLPDALQTLFAMDRDYLINSYYLIGLFALFCLSIGIETFHLFFSQRKQIVSPLRYFIWLLLRSSLRSFPYLLWLLAMLAEPEFRKHFIQTGIACWLVVNGYYLFSHSTPYQLVFTAYRETAVKRRWRWAKFLFCGLILLSAILPPFIDVDYRSRLSMIKANMHTLQTMVETYAYDWKGIYPASLRTLEQEAKHEGVEYWHDTTNPCTGLTGIAETYVETPLHKSLLQRLSKKTYQNWMGIRFQLKETDTEASVPEMACKIFYMRQDPSHYQIFGTDLKGRLILNKNEGYFLSNS